MKIRTDDNPRGLIVLSRVATTASTLVLAVALLLGAWLVNSSIDTWDQVFGWALVFVGVAQYLVVLGIFGLHLALWEKTVQRRWRLLCQALKLTRKVGDREEYPTLHRVEGRGRHHFAAVIKPLMGQSLGHFEAVSEQLAQGFGSGAVRLTANTKRQIVFETVDEVPPEAVAIEESVEVARRMFEAPERGDNWRDRLRATVIGMGADGKPWVVPMVDSHVLIVGATGAGKGSVVWSMVLNLIDAKGAGVVRLWGLDPKRMELSFGIEFWDRYASSGDDMLAMLREIAEDVNKRADMLAGRQRKFTPSVEMPHNVVVIDEYAYLVAYMPDRKKRQEAEELIAGILTIGRSVGYTIIGATQDPRVEVLKHRDLFPIRLCLRVNAASHVDMALGSGARKAGAAADMLPEGAENGGLGYVMSETSKFPRLVRAFWVSDDVIKVAARCLLDGQLDALAKEPIGIRFARRAFRAMEGETETSYTGLQKAGNAVIELSKRMVQRVGQGVNNAE